MSEHEDIALLRELPRRVIAAGYLDVYRAYRGLPMERGKLREELGQLAADLGPLVRLFGLADRVARAGLEPTLGGGLLDALERLRVLWRDDADVHTAGMYLLPMLGRLAFVPGLKHSPVALFGDDTASLAARLAPGRAARCLNLCAGSGALALHLASLAPQVLAVEDSAVARACAELNVALNGLDDRIEVRAGTGAELAQAGDRFDHVSANPALLPFPQELLGVIASDQGGSPTERVLGQLPQLLAEGGLAQIIGTGLGSAAGPRVAALLEQQVEQHGLSAALLVTSQVALDPGSRMLAALADNTARAGILSIEEARRRMLGHLERTDSDRVFLFHITVSRAGRGGLSVSRPDSLGGGYWSR